MKNIVIRTLGGGNIGYGHFYRCLSLSKAIRLEDKMINIIFLINNDLVDLIKHTDFQYIVSNKLGNDYKVIKDIDMDLFILDSYLGNNEYLRMIKSLTKLMLIDDNNDIYDSSIPDIIYNGNIHAEKLNYKETKGQLRLLGTKYLIMKEEYWNDDKNEGKINKDGILITTGGNDQYEVAIKILEEIKDIGLNIRVIIGPGYKDDYIKRIKKIKNKNIELIYKPDSLKKYIRESKIVITAGGSTVYEVLSQNSMPIVFSIADNQDLICRELEDRGFEYLGKYPEIEYCKLKMIIKERFNIEINSFDEKLDWSNTKGYLKIKEEIIKSIGCVKNKNNK